MKKKDTKNSLLQFIAKLMIAVLLGALITGLSIERSDQFRLLVRDYVISFFESCVHCKAECKITSFGLFSPRLSCEFLRVKPYGEGDKSEWSFEFKDVELQFSWIDLLMNGVIDLYVEVGNAEVASLGDAHGLCIWKMIEKCFEGDDISIPVLLKSLSVGKGAVHIKEKNEQYESRVQFASITKNMSGAYKTKISFLGGDASVYSKQLFDGLSGFLGLTIIQKSNNTYVYVDSKCAIDAQFLNENKTCFVTGKWTYDQGYFDLISQDKSFSVMPIKLYFLGDTLFAELVLKGALGDMAGFVFAEPGDLSGDCMINLRGEFGPLGLGASGSLVMQQVTYSGTELFSFGKLAFKHSKNKHKGFMSFERTDGIVFAGNLGFDSKSNTLLCNLSNETDLKVAALPYWKIKPKQAKVQIGYDHCVHGNCTCCAESEQLGSCIDVVNNITLENNIIRVIGNIGDKKYELGMRLFPSLGLEKFVYQDVALSSGVDKFDASDLSYASETPPVSVVAPLVSLHALENDMSKFTGYIQFPFIKSLAKEFFDYTILGEGDVWLHGACKDSALLLQLAFKHGSVSFPDFYNFLDNCRITSKIDFKKKSIIAQDSVINFHKGAIECKKAVLHFDESFKPCYVYAPFVCRNCFVNIKNDLFALVSGRMLFAQEKDHEPLLSGLAIIERSHVKRNIFAGGNSDMYATHAQLSKSGFANYLQSINCDISVISKEPVRINMESLNAAVNVNVGVKSKLLDPQLSGKIDFLSGTIAFPYKPLTISKGAIYFLPHQSNDPLIELVARNKINKYNVTMYVTGSFEDQQISFESSPPLTEEQVIALLIAGSAQESLNVVAPALIMQQVKDSLFGSGESRVGKKNYLGKFLKPFKKVRVVPSFIDQTGRGGLRGAVEVEINNRWRAFVEKNFSLSEDTRFEIEYLLSDDVSVRGLRRENGDIGGEVEMRWRF